MFFRVKSSSYLLLVYKYSSLVIGITIILYIYTLLPSSYFLILIKDPYASFLIILEIYLCFFSDKGAMHISPRYSSSMHLNNTIIYI